MALNARYLDEGRCGLSVRHNTPQVRGKKKRWGRSDSLTARRVVILENMCGDVKKAGQIK